MENKARPSPALAGFIDVEASGIHPDSYPIKIAICSAGGLPVYEALIRPTSYWKHWCHDAQDFHGIERSDLLEHGTDTRLVAHALNERFAGMVLISDANQDGFWLEVLFETVDFEPAFTVVNALNILPSELLPSFLGGYPAAKAHRPMDDAIALRNAWYGCGAGNIWEQHGGTYHPLSVESDVKVR